MFKPYDLASLKVENSSRRRVVEIISRPFSTTYPGQDRIKIRMVPGEPTTLAEVAVADLLPFRKDRYVHIARVKSQFVFPEDMLRYDGAALFDHDLHEEGPVDERWPGRRGLKIPKEGLLVYTTSNRKRPKWTDARWRSFSAWLTPVLTRDLRNMADNNVVSRG